MIAEPPLRFQNVSAALSSEERSIRSSSCWSAGVSSVWPLATCNNRSSAMNSFTTDAMAMVPSRPLVTNSPVSRSSTATLMSAPARDASAVACWARAGKPSKAGSMLGGAAGVLSAGAPGSSA